jgi:hypothetical protein
MKLMVRMVTAQRAIWRCSVTLLVIGALLVSGLAPIAGAWATGTTTMGPAPESLPQSWVAGFHLSGHFFHPGDTITGTITVKVAGCISAIGPQYPCYKGTEWSLAGAKCKATALVCSWIAAGGSAGTDWTVLSMPILNPIGSAESADYYTIVDKNTFALDGHVLDTVGNPIAGVAVDIIGKENRHLTTDPTGYYSALLPRGTYTVDVSTGSSFDSHWFQPRSRTVVLQDFATADFTGTDHTEVQFKDHALVADGLQTTTVTIKYLNPLNQPVPNQALRIDTSGPKVLVCSMVPNHIGRIAPTDLINGEPLNLPDTATTDAQGTLTYQVYAGTESGTVDIAADPAGNSAATDTQAFSHDSLDLKSAPALSRFPMSFKISYKTSNGELVPRENLTTLLWADLHGKILGRPPVSFSEVSGAAITEQQTMLRWIANDLLSPGYEGAPLAGVEITPISGPGGTNPAVLLFLPGRPSDDRNTRVLDANVFNALIGASSSDYIPADLPTRSEWTSLVGGTTIDDYVQPAPEQGLTYHGFPYLPGPDAAFNAFGTQCLQRAQ